VLLKGVNDDSEILGALMRALVECRIKPYYLRHLDRAPGMAHFRTTLAEGRELMRALRERYSGLCQPTHMRDGPAGEGKVLVGASVQSRQALGGPKPKLFNQESVSVIGYRYNPLLASNLSCIIAFCAPACAVIPLTAPGRLPASR
jgi:L-lysine 2,3-aminomutase